MELREKGALREYSGGKWKEGRHRWGCAFRGRNLPGIANTLDTSAFVLSQRKAQLLTGLHGSQEYQWGMILALLPTQPRFSSSVAQRECTQVTGRLDHFQCTYDTENLPSFLSVDEGHQPFGSPGTCHPLPCPSEIQTGDTRWSTASMGM